LGLYGLADGSARLNWLMNRMYETEVWFRTVFCDVELQWHLRARRLSLGYRQPVVWLRW